MALNVQGSSSLFWKTGIDVTGLKLGAKQSKGIVAGLAASITKADVFFGLGLSAGIAFKKAIQESYKFSREFETAMKEVQTISNAVKNNFAGISQEIIDLSKIVPDRADQLAKAYYQIVSAGYDGAEALDMLAVSAKLAVAGVTDTFVAADAITSIMNAYGDAAGNAQNISDKLFMTVKLGKTKMEELGPSITTVTGLAAQAGMKFDDLMAIIAKGVKTLGTNEMMTGVRGMLIALTKQQDETKKKAKELGIEFNLTTLKTKGFSYFLKELKENTGGNVEILAELFPRVQGLSGLLAVATEAGGDFDEVLKQIANSAGSTEAAFRIMIATTDNQIALLRNIILAKMKPLGDDMLAHVNKIAKGFNNAMTGYVAEFESYMSKLRDFESKGVDLDKYIKEYESLKKKQKLSSDEQDRLNGLIADIALIAPGAVTAYNDIGEAMGINTDHARMLFEIELNRLRISKEGSKAIENYVNELEKASVLLDSASEYEEGYSESLTKSKKTLDELLSIKEKEIESISAESEEYKKLSESTKHYLIYSGMVTEMDEHHTTALEMNGKMYNNLDDAIHSASNAFSDLSDKTTIATSNYNTYILGLGRYVDTSKTAVEIAKDFQLYMGMGGTEALIYAEKLKTLIEVKKELGDDDGDGGAEDAHKWTEAELALISYFDTWRKSLGSYEEENAYPRLAKITELIPNASDEDIKMMVDDFIAKFGEYVSELDIEELQFLAEMNLFPEHIDVTKLEDYKDDMTSIWEETADGLYNTIAGSISSAFADALVDGKADWGSFFDYLKKELIKMAMMQILFSPTGLLGPLLGGITGGITSLIGINKGGEVAGANQGGEILDWDNIVRMSNGGELNVGSDLNKDSVLTFLTRKEIVINRESSQENRELLLNINRDKKFVKKLNTGGSVNLTPHLNMPSFPSFPSSMDVSSNQLKELISAVKAQTINQMDQKPAGTNIIVKSNMPMEEFIIEFNKTQSKMSDRGYNGAP